MTEMATVRLMWRTGPVWASAILVGVMTLGSPSAMTPTNARPVLSDNAP